MAKATSLDPYFNTRVGAEILKSIVKNANFNPRKKVKVLCKLAKDLSADNIVKYLMEKKSALKTKVKTKTKVDTPLAKKSMVDTLKWPVAVGAPLSLAAATPLTIDKADDYHRNAYTPIHSSDYDLRVKQSAEGSIAQSLGGMGFGFGQDFLKELSHGVSQGPMSALSHKLSKNLFNLPTRVQSDETYGKELYKQLGKDTGSILVQRVQDKLREQQSIAIDKNVYSPMRKQIFDSLVKGRQADPQVMDALQDKRTDIDKLWNIYKTMVRFAPKLSTDLNAVKTFFRSVLHMGDGETIDHVLIKQIADTETAINKAVEGGL